MKAAVQKRQSLISKIENALEGRFFLRLMSVAYGLGASIVILGALFKITHIKGANEALFIGMITEAIIFALSALQKPHVEPDWSKVHPQLRRDYHDESEGNGLNGNNGGQMNKLDQMLQNANIDDELIGRLGQGLNNLSNSASQMNDLAKTGAANDVFLTNLKTASHSVATLSKSYDKTAEALAQEMLVSNEFSSSVKEVSKAATQLKQVYAETSNSLKQDIDATQILSKSIKSASESANKLASSYFQSSESIMKNIDELQKSTEKNSTFNTQLKKLSDNLSSLNTLYELQMKSTEQQTQSSAKLQQTMIKFLADMDKSASQTVNYQRELDSLTKKMSSLNSVYGNMLTAMNVK